MITHRREFESFRVREDENENERLCVFLGKY